MVVNCIVDASICGRPRYRELCCAVARLFVFLFGSSCGARRFWCAPLVRRSGAVIVVAGRRWCVVVARRSGALRAVCRVVLCVVRFYERSVDALASGADEGRGGLR